MMIKTKKKLLALKSIQEVLQLAQEMENLHSGYKK